MIEGTAILDAYQYYVAATSAHGKTEDRQFANVALIAAAPDLADACDPETIEAIAYELMTEYKHSARAAGLLAIADKQRTALRKARGE